MSGYYPNSVTQVALDAATSRVCFCIGPQGGRPLCPCQMRGIVIRDGRYIKPEQDLGPVVEADKERITK